MMVDFSPLREAIAVISKETGDRLPSKRVWIIAKTAKMNLPPTPSETFCNGLDSNIMVKVVKLYTGVLWKRCSDEFYRKHLWGSLLFNKVSYLQAKERLLHRYFPVSFTKYFRALLLQNTSGSLLLLNNFFCLLRRPQPQKMFPSALVILNIFETNTWNCLRTAFSGAYLEREGGREFSPTFFQNLEKGALIWRKSAVIMIIYGCKILFKVKLLRVSRQKNGDFSLLDLSFELF